MNGKIQALNNAMREAIPHMRDAASGNPSAELLLRVLKFSSGASWHVSTPVPIENFSWTDLAANGVTDMGRAFSMVAEQLRIPPMESRALPPVLALISDGQPTDDYASGLDAIMAEQWGKRAVRVAIGIGADADHHTLQKFIGNPEIPVLQADNLESLIQFIRWVSTAVVKTASAPTASTGGESIVMPPPPFPTSGVAGTDDLTVW
ncbi:MAG: tellurium resistance protein [Planctomycetaceae bacterium]|nr:tellurium resistance protein [Planctomycetaceae bacterium]